MDLTVYLFDSTKAVRAVITRGIVQLIHKERARTLNAEIPVKYAAKPGEYLGFACVDGRFRLFAIDYADDDDNTATTVITATDGAKDELTGTVITVAEQESIAISEAARGAIEAAGWTLGLDETEGKATALEGGLKNTWAVLEALETDGNLFIDPYYAFDGKTITGRVVDLSGKKPVYTGRLVQRGTDAENIVITHKSRPRPMIYPEGADGLTIAGTAWSTEAGDPVDKPAGQMWIGVPEAVEKYPGQGQVLSVDTDDPNELMQKGWEAAQKAAQPAMTATATISDMEMIRGQSWKSIRLFYIVRVRPRFGQDAEAQVVEIARNYVRNDETKITLGEEPDSSARQIRGLVKTTAANTREMTKTKTELRETLVQVKELEQYTETTISDVYIKLSAAEAAILLAATKEELRESEDYYERQYSEVAIRLDAAETQLLLTATKEEVSGLEEDISQAHILIDGAQSEIQLKADKTYVDNLVAQEIEAAVADISATFADSVSTEYLVASTYATFNCPISYQGDTVIKRTGSVITNASGSTATVQEYELLTTGTGDSYTMELGSVSDERIEELIQEALGDLGAISTLELNVEGDTTLGGRLTVGSLSNFNGKIYANSGIDVTGNVDVSGSVTAAAADIDSLTYKDTLLALNEASIPSNMSGIFGAMVGFNVQLGDGSTKIIYAWQNNQTARFSKIQYLGANVSED